jgi:ketosteroid isomerase-like protein
MESDELRLVRSICAARERGDYSSADWADPEIEYVLADGPAPGTFHGLDEMARGIRDFLSAWEGFRAVVEGYRELGDHRILVLLTLKGRGKTSGLDLEETQTKGADLFHLRNGRVTRIVHYFDRHRVLDELGRVSDPDVQDV